MFSQFVVLYITWNIFVGGFYGALNLICIYYISDSRLSLVRLTISWLSLLSVDSLRSGGYPKLDLWGSGRRQTWGLVWPHQSCCRGLRNCMPHPKHCMCWYLVWQDMWFLGWGVKFLRSQLYYYFNICHGSRWHQIYYLRCINILIFPSWVIIITSKLLYVWVYWASSLWHAAHILGLLTE